MISPEELDLLRQSARRALARVWAPDTAVAGARDPARLQEAWALAAENGWLALAPQDELGGLKALAIVAEELGRAACPLPLVDAAAARFACTRAGGAAAKTLEALAEGRAALSFTIPPAGAVTLAGTTLDGVARHVEGLSIATHLLLLIDGTLVLVARDAAGITRTANEGFAVPALEDVTFSDTPAHILGTLAGRADDIVAVQRVLAAARALGGAARGFELATDYAKVRHQFGQPIGRFQAIQHKLANSLIALDASRILITRAAGACDNGDDGWTDAAAMAFAFASEGLRSVARENHHAIGGVSFFEEHEAPRHFRRIHADLIRFGGAHGAREDLAKAAFARALRNEEPALPDLDLGPGANALRQDVRAWLKEHWTAAARAAQRQLPKPQRGVDPEFSRKLGAKGWLSLAWPKEQGGQGRSPYEQFAFAEEMGYARAPTSFHTCAVYLQGPAIMKFGTPEQCAQFLPMIREGRAFFCLGYSEPEAGSDLASLKTRATRDGDEWVINGSKLFTTLGEFADYMWLAARTDPEAKPRHAGISVFILPLKLPGVSIHPMKGISGKTANAIFFDSVRLPLDALVGQVNQGWKVITTALAHERIVMGGNAAITRANFDAFVRHVATATRGGKPLRDDPYVRDRVGALIAEFEAARMLTLQTIAMLEDGRTPVHEAAESKVFTGELEQRFTETALDILGPEASYTEDAPGAAADGAVFASLTNSLMMVIGGGTNEVQRTLIAVQGLGLPR